MWDPLQPESPRPLTDREHRGLIKMGFLEIAQRFSAPCEDCGGALSGSTHYMMCRRPFPGVAPEKARDQPIQPWEPKSSRRS